MSKLALSRRYFLQSASAVAAMSGLPMGLVKESRAATPQKTLDATGETKVVKTACRGCIHNCAVLAHVRNGRVIKVEGNPEFPMTHGALCAKGLSAIQALYHPNRNKYPMIRVGKRGENKWKRISWKEAIDILAHKLMQAREKYGAESVLISTGGGGNPAFRGVRRFANTFGTPNFFEPGCAQCFLPRTLAFGLMYGGPTTSIADEHCLELYNPNPKTQVLVLWGTDPSYSCPGGGGRVLADLRAKGVKTVCIDPRFIPDAAKADVWLPIRPGTDVALMLAWIKYLIDHDLYDHEFTLKWTNLPYLVNTETHLFLHGNDLSPDGDPKAYVVWDKKTNSAQPLVYPWNDAYDVELDGEHTVNGSKVQTGFRALRLRVAEWSLEKAGKVCRLDPKKIEKAIQIYASGPGGVALGVATDQHELSVQSAMGACILNALMGNVEIPGALMQRRPSSNVVPAGSLATACSFILPEGQLKKRLGGIEYKGLLQWDAAQIPAVLEAIKTGKPYQPHIWIERSGNKFAVVGNASSWEPAMDKLDFIVHMFMYPTSFSAYADMILPATEWLETNMLVENLNMIFARQAVTHLYETADETLFWGQLVKRLAELGHENCQKARDPEWMKAHGGKLDVPYWDSMEHLLDMNLSRVGLTWKELLKKNPYTYMPFDKWNQYYVYKKPNPKTGKPTGFHTPSGKLELYGEVFIQLGRTGAPYAKEPLPPASKDYDPLPYYVEPAESPDRPIGKTFPLVLTSGRLPMYHHGTLRNIPYLRELYAVPEVWVNPIDAKTYGLKEGDWTYVESQRGKISAKAHLTEGIAPGVVYMERFWNPETLMSETHGWKEMNVNLLTKNDPPFNDMVGTYTLRGFQVRIAKAEGAPKGIWTEPKQFAPWMPKPTDPTAMPEF